MERTVTIAGREYRLRRQTYAAMLDEQGAVGDVAEAEDRVKALGLRLDHTAAALNELAAASTTGYDHDREAALLADRKAIRDRQSAALRDYVHAQMRLIAVRLVDGPSPADLMETLTAVDAAGILEGMDDAEEAERPTPPPSEGSPSC